MGKTLAANVIVVALNSMASGEKERARNKFDAYFLAIEQIPFCKFPSICELECRHGVNKGTSYTTETAARSFIHLIAESKRKNWLLHN